MNKRTGYSPGVRERAVRMVFEHQAENNSPWAALKSIAVKIGCTAETLRKWVRRADPGRLPLRETVSEVESQQEADWKLTSFLNKNSLLKLLCMEIHPQRFTSHSVIGIAMN
ncbi:hypothetical protein DFR30_2174 [Thiogranum longum]|uniref:Transposase n=1 Tax=Thiogranum longum TaxID=1537524 RepID=A0A4R1HHK9_9GAMM|nr:hypothetical protein DFR30_2174 [Thiogranum longum]